MRSLPPLVDALRDPRAYDHAPSGVDLRQTHISWVFLADEWVYKVKKPVRFEFLDYSTAERRRFFCHEEVRLNRRLAPAVYEGVVSIVDDEGIRVRESAEAPGALEHAVKMRRLPAEGMLDVRLREGEAGTAEIEALAARIADFHARASTESAPRYGVPEVILDGIRADLSEMRPHCGDVLSLAELEEIDTFYQSFFEREHGCFARRLAGGRIREGHGDLRAEHVCLTDPIVVFDCIEFSERLRTVDVASELGFLTMDLESLGEPLLARKLVDAYGEASGDRELRTLLPFYGCYRACVRGKVETLKSLEEAVPELERRQSRLRAQRYFRLARRFVRGAPPPSLIVVCGPSGTGKTTVARLRQAETGFPLRRSDVERKRLAGLRTTDRAGAEPGGGIYTPELSRRTYERLLEEAERLLRTGEGAIIEATFLRAEQRAPFRKLAARLGVPSLFIECRASEAEIARRLEARAGDPEEASDAGIEIYRRQRDRFEPLAPDEGVVVDTAALIR